jgi:hypothetical protein
MPETPVPTSQPGRAYSLAACERALRWMPPKARLPVLTGSLVLTALAVYMYLSSGSAYLNLVCRHNLQSAGLSVFIDGELTYADQLSGSPMKRFGVFGKRAEKTFSKSLAVPSGEHVVQVNVKSVADGFDQTKLCRFDLPHGKEATLLIAAEKNGMSLVFQGPPRAQTEGAGSGYAETIWSILVTVIGSAASAGIGFYFQEFLRSRKAS